MDARHRARLVSRVALPAVWVAAALPLAQLIRRFATGDAGTDPVETIQLATGLAALSLLWASLAVTPLRQATGWNELIRLRKPLGLAAFGYAVLHALSYFVFDQELSPTGIAADVVEHPWVLAGFTSLLLLVPLALTSTAGMIRRLGRRWQPLHRLVYPAAILASLHFVWLVKRDLTRPLLFGAGLALLLGWRVWHRIAVVRQARLS